MVGLKYNIMATQVWYDEPWWRLGEHVERQNWRNHSKEHRSLNRSWSWFSLSWSLKIIERQDWWDTRKEHGPWITFRKFDCISFNKPIEKVGQTLIINTDFSGKYGNKCRLRVILGENQPKAQQGLVGISVRGTKPFMISSIAD